jgi:hypothetical protein
MKQTPEASGRRACASHESSVRSAALWLAAQAEPPRPIVPALKDRFALSAAEACQACALAADLRKEGAHGETNSP